MAATMENWVHERGNVTEKDRIALEKAKRLEAKQAKHGYQWYKINDRLKVFIPFGKNGKPTLEGMRKIEILKAQMGCK